MSSADSCQAQRTSKCSLPPVLPPSESILMRCPDLKGYPQCSPPVIADPEVPEASWVLCHAWIQTMPHARALSIDKCAAEHAIDDASATYQHVGSHEGASNLVSACPAIDRHAQTGSNGGRSEEEECALPPPSFSSPQVPITRALVKAIQRELLVEGPGSHHATSVKQWRSDYGNATTSDFVPDIAESLEPRSVKQLQSKLVPMPCLPRTGSIPIERDYAMSTQYPSAVSPLCPSANQWKRVYDSPEKTKLPRPPQSISDCSRIHKVVRRPSNGSTFIPIQGKPAGPDAETAPYVVTDESSDSSGGKSVETDTSAENLTRSSESGSDSEIMARDSVSQASSNSVGVHDYREDSGFAKRDYRFAKPAPRHGKSDKRDMKPTNEHYNILGLSPHTDVESAKEAFIGKRMQDMHTSETDLNLLFRKLRMLRIAYRLVYLTRPAQIGVADTATYTMGLPARQASDSSESVSPARSPVQTAPWAIMERPTPHPRKYIPKTRPLPNK